MTPDTTKPLVHHLIILDESGSMSSVREQTIRAFNELMAKNDSLVAEYPDQEHRLTFVTFNTAGIRTVCFDIPLNEPIRLSPETYVPDHSTPLWDAMGSSVLKVKHHIYGHPDHKVLVTVITDGMENASREFSGKEIKMMIEGLREKNWVFTYLGADHDVDSVADGIGIHSGNRLNWDKNRPQHSWESIHQMRTHFATRLRGKEKLEEDLMKKALEEMESDKNKNG